MGNLMEKSLGGDTIDVLFSSAASKLSIRIGGGLILTIEAPVGVELPYRKVATKTIAAPMINYE